MIVQPSCTTEKQLNTLDVEFMDIEEDTLGRDVLTYRCPLCNQVHKSIVRSW